MDAQALRRKDQKRKKESFILDQMLTYRNLCTKHEKLLSFFNSGAVRVKGFEWSIRRIGVRMSPVINWF